MRKPIAVIISDIHYNLQNMQLADASLRASIDSAGKLQVPLIVAGDIHDQKAVLRGECIKTILDTYDYARYDRKVQIITLVGNHDKINEKGEGHSLEFLRESLVIDKPTELLGFYFIPYQSDPEEFERIIKTIPKGSTIIMHQGVTGADKGEYVHDKSAINKDLLADYRTISGHYHKAQDIKCGPPRKGAVGLMSYIGTPYTVTFAEANDGPKGFQVLYDDGLLEQVPLNLRKHVILEFNVPALQCYLPNCHSYTIPDINPGDLIWVKIDGPALELDELKKTDIAKKLGIDHISFKLDKIVTDGPELEAEQVEKKSGGEILDALIDSSGESSAKKAELKALWRGLV